jgi:hypothetical protein
MYKLLLFATILLLFSCQSHPLPDNPQWARYSGSGSGARKHIILLAGDQEYRSEEVMPMLAKILSVHHNFDCTVLFAINEQGEVDPAIMDNIPGIEHLSAADLVIVYSRFLSLPNDQMQHFFDFLDSGTPIIGIRTANHGFKKFFVTKNGKQAKYAVAGKNQHFGVHILGGTFAGHYGGWHREGTRGVIVKGQEKHPILKGVTDIFGPTDVYSTNPQELYGDSQAILLGQPLVGLKPTDKPNTKKPAIPIGWTKTWTGNTGKTSRIFQITMGSAEDFLSEGLRRLVINASYWCLEMESKITSVSKVDIVGTYQPSESDVKKHIKGRTPAFYEKLN